MDAFVPGLISVIMPVYNSEKTLSKSAESVLSQSYENLELILVNDGSKDGSPEICRMLEKNDQRVRVIDQANAGVAMARNTALDAVKGEYIMFVDSDDILSPDACQIMVNALGNNEMTISHYYFVLGDIQSPRGLIKGNRTLNEQDFLDVLVKRPGAFYFSALWNKLYKTELIRKANLRFDPFLSWGEDFAFNMQYYRGIHNGVALVEKPLYHYIKSPGSTSIRTLIHVVHSCQIKWRLYLYFKGLYEEKGLFQKYRFYIRRYILNVTLAD